MDGHKSHITIPVINWAKQHNVIIQILPAHSSHFLQPLDVGCYGPFENIYNSLCHKTIRLSGCTITKHDVCELACNAYGKSLSAGNLQSDFRKCGIYPFDRTVINDDIFKAI